MLICGPALVTDGQKGVARAVMGLVVHRRVAWESPRPSRPAGGRYQGASPEGVAQLRPWTKPHQETACVRSQWGLECVMLPRVSIWLGLKSVLSWASEASTWQRGSAQLVPGRKIVRFWKQADLNDGFLILRPWVRGLTSLGSLILRQLPLRSKEETICLILSGCSINTGYYHIQKNQ